MFFRKILILKPTSVDRTFRSSVVPAVFLDQCLRRAGRGIHEASKRPQFEQGDEGRTPARVEQTDLHVVFLRHRDDLGDKTAVRSDSDGRPEINSEAEIEDRRGALAIVVAVKESGANKILVPGLNRRQPVAIPSAVWEAPKSFVSPI